MSESQILTTSRLRLRAPRPADAEAIFGRYASDPATTRYLSFPRHTSLADTGAFLAFSQSAWAKWPAGPMLIESRETGEILGSTGLDFETPLRAATGFLLVPAARGHGFASEALSAVAAFAEGVGVRRLYAICHTGNARSARVLERCGFRREGILGKYAVFPNLGDAEPQDVYCYARISHPGRGRGHPSP